MNGIVFAQNDQSWDDFLKELKIVSKIKTAFPQLTPGILADAFSELEKLNISVSSINLNSKTYTSVRKWENHLLDIETKETELRKGIMGMIWGAQFIISNKIPDNTVLLLSNSDLENKTGLILKLSETTIPEAKELINLYEKLMIDFSSCHTNFRKISGLLEKILRKVE